MKVMEGKAGFHVERTDQGHHHELERQCIAWKRESSCSSNLKSAAVCLIVVTCSDTAIKGPIACLPESYTSIPPATLIKQDPPVPQLTGPNKADCQIIPQAVEEEYRLVLTWFTF